jgi:hypothetical protein
MRLPAMTQPEHTHPQRPERQMPQPIRAPAQRRGRIAENQPVKPSREGHLSGHTPMRIDAPMTPIAARTDAILTAHPATRSPLSIAVATLAIRCSSPWSCPAPGTIKASCICATLSWVSPTLQSARTESTPPAGCFLGRPRRFGAASPPAPAPGSRRATCETSPCPRPVSSALVFSWITLNRLCSVILSTKAMSASVRSIRSPRRYLRSFQYMLSSRRMHFGMIPPKDGPAP